MIILHTGVYEDQILLWGEVPLQSQAAPAQAAPARPEAPATKGRGRPATGSCLPYDAGSERLSAALNEAGLGFTADERQTGVMAVWLPTKGTKPVASSPLIAEPPASRAKIALAPWLVSVLGLSTEQAVELFCTCVDKQILASGVIAGHDLTFWTSAMRLAGALVARQQFLPAVSREDGVYRACWKPVLTGAGAGALARMAAAMPSAARALSREEASSPPEVPAAFLLSEFIDMVVDYLVRNQQPPAFPAVPATAVPATAVPISAVSKAGVKRGRKTIASKAAAFDSIHDQWLYALRSPDGMMEGEAVELAQLAAQVEEWQRPVSALAATPFRLCFRLEEPEETSLDETGLAGKKDVLPHDGGSWYVRYLLQAANDPSLLIPAQDAWKGGRNGRGGQGSVFREAGFNAREYLLLSLGQASGLSSRIEASLKTSAPAGYEIDTGGAYEFLTEKASALEQAGFGVMLPAWWTRKGTKVRLSVRGQVKSPKMQGGAGLSLDQMVKFDWEVALGDEKLSFEELQTLARLKVPLVRVRGQWVQMSAEEIKAALDFWKKKSEGRATARDIVQMALGAGKPKGTLDFQGITATGWIADLLDQLEGRARFEELAAPEDFHGSLRPYQVRGYSWLSFLEQWGLGACLADDMGLGKTIQTLALIERDWHLKGAADRRPVLLICPTSVVGNWQKEASRFTPDLPVMVHHGLARARGAAFKKEAARQAIVISSYALLHRDFDILKTVAWAGVILDEAQNIKNPETKQARAARTITQGGEIDQSGKIARTGKDRAVEARSGEGQAGKARAGKARAGEDQAGEDQARPYRLALTGTPVENNVGDLWSIMEFLNPGLLGQQAEFKRSFFIPIQANRDRQAMEQLKRLTGPFILRRLKTDKTIIDDLPEKMEMKVFCNLTKEQASLYTAVVKEASSDLDSAEGIKRKGVVLATLMKLKQVCNHPAQFLGDNSVVPGRSGKLARLTEMMEEIIEVGDKALVFSQFAEMGQILRRHLQETFGREVLFLHGAVTKKKRDSMVERFQSESESGGPAIFILSLKAGGTGLNLTSANHVFHFDRWWNPAVENQATDRAFRIGQTKNVQVHKFLCVGTLEEKIDDMIERKKDVAQQVVGTGEGWLTELSTSELKELFALKKEAVGE